MRISNYLAAIFSLAALISCSTGDVKKMELQGEEYKFLAVQKYGEGVEFIQNLSGTAMLCVKSSKPTQLNPQHQIAFFVYDVKAKSVLFEDSIPNGSVNWKDDFSIVVTVVPGTIRDDDKTRAPRPGYIYDLRIRKTRDLESVDVR
jgi:hypothetical protein